MSARILVVEDNAANLQLMVYLLKAFGHEPSEAMDGEEALLEVAREAPDLVVCDIQLPRMDGYEVVRLLKANPEWRPIPLVAVTAFAMVGDRDRVLAAGFDGYIPKPIVPQTFVAQLEAFLPSAQRSSAMRPAAEAVTAPPAPVTENPRATILIVDNSRANLDLARHLMAPSGYAVMTAESVDEALDAARKTCPDLILSDLHMPGKGGFDLLREVRADAKLKDLPFVFISSTYSGEIDQATARSSGADAFILRPIAPRALLLEIEQHLAARMARA